MFVNYGRKKFNNIGPSSIIKLFLNLNRSKVECLSVSVPSIPCILFSDKARSLPLEWCPVRVCRLG